ncbi:TPA: hypothetical protein ACX6SS_002235 [Photobacterium damselae]
MERKSKLQQYYGELKHIERQRPDAMLSVTEVLKRLKEIKKDLEFEKQQEII